MFVDADSDSITIANILAFCDKSAIQPIPSNQNTV